MKKYLLVTIIILLTFSNTWAACKWVASGMLCVEDGELVQIRNFGSKNESGVWELEVTLDAVTSAQQAAIDNATAQVEALDNDTIARTADIAALDASLEDGSRVLIPDMIKQTKLYGTYSGLVPPLLSDGNGTYAWNDQLVYRNGYKSYSVAGPRTMNSEDYTAETAGEWSDEDWSVNDTETTSTYTITNEGSFNDLVIEAAINDDGDYVIYRFTTNYNTTGYKCASAVLKFSATGPENFFAAWGLATATTSAGVLVGVLYDESGEATTLTIRVSTNAPVYVIYTELDGFSLDEYHEISLWVNGVTYAVYIDGTLVATETTAGTPASTSSANINETYYVLANGTTASVDGTVTIKSMMSNSLY